MRELESSLQQFGEFLLKYPNAGRELAWYWVFPSRTLSTDPRARVVRRHHLHDLVIQKAVKAAAHKARIHKPVTVHTLRHYAGSRTMPSRVAIQPCFGSNPR
jgi:integrase